MDKIIQKCWLMETI